MGDETKFSVMCSLFTWIQKSKTSKLKRSKFRKFLDAYCKPGDYFSAIRLILPSLDRERGTYGLKESVLATCLVDALGMSRESEDAQRLFNWRKGGARTGVNAGNFALVASEVLQRRQGLTSGGLTIREINELLDRLASSENRAEKTAVLSELIKKTNAQEMKWIIMIILKDLKMGVSEKSIFHEFHPDAEDLFNVTCDLKLVCEKLWDRNQRHKRQDIEVGKAVRPQLAMRVGNASTAWKKLHGKDIVVECKFDGDRIQIHKNGPVINFFSRNFLDHPEYLHSMSELLEKNVLAERCILDGEMLVWDTSTNRFAEFGSNQEIARAAKEGLGSHRQICYVAFDILYVGDTSVIHQSLKERHDLLRKVIEPVKGRLEILIPNGGLNDRRPSGEPSWSFIAYNVDEVEKFFKETIENRDEGIVLKDLGSKWEPSDRTGKWLKLKPEYVRAGSDLDVLIIGGYYGSGRRGGEVAQFLVGLAERPAPDTYPRRFISFCRVGTGLSDEELDALVTKLKPYFRKYEYPKKTPPSFYQVTNNSKERPDVWIESPEKSVILSITSDIRTIRSEVFAAPYGLRFPRIDRVRYDKPWHECLDVQSFTELVQSSNGTTQGSSFGVGQDPKPKRLKSSKKVEKQNVSVVPPHFLQTDISDIKGETRIFSRMMFYFVNVPPTHSLDTLHKVVAENGGTFSMNLNKSVTHCIAAESKGIKFQAAKGSGDVIHYSWLLDCCSQKKLLPLQPKYFLHISDSSKKKLKEEIDEFSDPYYWDLDIEDMKQLLGNLERSKDSKRIDYYKRKLCPKDKWSYFHGCCIYFHPLEALCADAVVLTDIMLRRMKFEVTMGGGKVGLNLSQASHLVIISPLGLNVDSNTILRSLSSADVRVIQKKNLYVVGYRWLEECSKKEQKLEEETYSLKPAGLQDLNPGDRIRGPCFSEVSPIKNTEDPVLRSSPSDAGKVSVRQRTASNLPRVVNSTEKGGKRKRGRPTATSTNSSKGKNVVQPRKKRARVRTKLARINESDDLHASSDDNDAVERGNHELETTGGKECAGTSDKAIIEDFDSSSQQPPPSGLEQQGDYVRVKSMSDEEAHETSTSVGGGGGISNVPPRVGEKLEVMVDPVQSMLLDMIPSLGGIKGNVGAEPSVVIVEQKPAEDCNVGPPKKRKVSYKDMAADLLKDW